ncbi:hypothetical protein ABKA04_006195 [Annulohypoxylon sp. FPYF3050]
MASSVDAKLLRATKFPPEFNQKVDMQKVNLQVMKKWIASKISEILGSEDDVVTELCFNLIEGPRYPDIKSMQIQLTGFLDKDTAQFCKDLWNLCLSAQSNPQGVPKELLEAKKLELIQEKTRLPKRPELDEKTKNVVSASYQIFETENVGNVASVADAATTGAAVGDVVIELLEAVAEGLVEAAIDLILPHDESGTLTTIATATATYPKIEEEADRNFDAFALHLALQAPIRETLCLVLAHAAQTAIVADDHRLHLAVALEAVGHHLVTETWRSESDLPHEQETTEDAETIVEIPPLQTIEAGPRVPLEVSSTSRHPATKPLPIIFSLAITQPQSQTKTSPRTD